MIGECGNADMRDRLPDLLHDRLPPTTRAEVQAHLDQCADCRAELALLQRVRAAAMAVPAAPVNTGRIVAAVPAYRRPSFWARASRSTLIRIAAVIVLAIGGSMLVSDEVPQLADEPRVAPIVPVATTPGTPATRGATSQVTVRPRQTQHAELAVGETFDDLSDSELQALLKAMESLEARTPAEPEVVIPAVSRGGA